MKPISDISTHTFYKLHGAGNDFVLFVNPPVAMPGSEQIRQICDRRRGVGADGLMRIFTDDTLDFRLEYFNADGSAGEMCGNGARCAVWLAHHLGLAPQRSRFSVWGVSYQAEVVENQQVRLKMNPPQFPAATMNLAALCNQQFPAMGWLNTGVPHLVVAVAGELADVNVRQTGAFFRYHPQFQPQGVNVNFIRPDVENELSVRVYERGVEDETLACGTGAVACAVYAARHWQYRSPVNVHTAGGVLQIDFDAEFHNVFLTGPVTPVFTGILDPKFMDLDKQKKAAQNIKTKLTREEI